MTPEIQRQILRACGRFIGKKIQPVEDRIKAVELNASDLVTKSEVLDFQEKIEKRLGEVQQIKEIPGPKGDQGDSILVSDVVKELLQQDSLSALFDLIVEERVQKYFQDNPIQHGRDGIDGSKGDTGERGEPGERGEKGADGTGLADALIDRDGALVLTMTDGRAKALGVVVGNNGSDGRNGKDGEHGISFDNVTGEYDAERGFVLTLSQGERKAEFILPYMVHKGFWREGMKVKAAESITHDGALWIAKRDNAAKPCLENADDWQLAARKGRDGVDGKSYRTTEPVKL